MTNQLMILPLLDGMVPDGPIPEDSGSCSFAVRHEASGTRLYVKKISVPESPSNTDALLLAGVIKERVEADDYYLKEINELRNELSVFAALSKSDYLCGFLRFQVQPKESHPGYDLYLLSRRMVSLPEFLIQQPITKLQAASLAEDLCRGLTEIRNSGYIHRNLKPSNIFFDKNHFCIGDLGLVSVEAPNKALTRVKNPYFSAPEVSLNTQEMNATCDIYSVGLILYYLFNGGHLPFDEAGATAKSANQRRIHGEELPSPMYADYEMGRIISRACAFLPEDRYQSPEEMLKDLLDYKKSTPFTDDPLVPPLVTADYVQQPTTNVVLPEEAIAPENLAEIDSSSEDFIESFMPSSVEEEKRKKKSILPLIIPLILLFGGIAAAVYYFFYSAITVKSIEATDKGVDYITVEVDANSYELLTITCSCEANGHYEVRSCTSSQTFTGLSDSSIYTFTVAPSDWHYMKGASTCSSMTSGYTEISSFTAVDNDDGTATVNIQVSGPEPLSWNLAVSDGSGEEAYFSILDHSCVVTGLEPGVRYTFSILDAEGYNLRGSRSVEYQRELIVSATSITVESAEAGKIVVVWEADSDAEIEWTVQCSGSKGYSDTIVTTNRKATFLETPASSDYTITLINDCMAAPLITTAKISAGTIKDFAAKETDTCVHISWEFEGPETPEGWNLNYICESIGIDEVVKVTECSYDLKSYVPNAAYRFTISPADEALVDGDTICDFHTAGADPYTAHNFGGIYSVIFQRPSENWKIRNLSTYAPATLKAGTQYVYCIQPGNKPNNTAEEEPVSVMIVVRNADADPVYSSSYDTNYNALWDGKLFATEFTAPSEKGSYTVELYFNLGFVAKKSISVG